jgi:hypothetical protein
MFRLFFAIFNKKEWPFLATFCKLAISQPKRIQNEKIGHFRRGQQKLS